jgi:hypothetical protein
MEEGARRQQVQERATGKTVPLYHLDLVDSNAVSDEGRVELSDDIAAMDAAAALAKRLLQERPELKNRHYAILVTNEHGDEICRIPLDIIH